MFACASVSLSHKYSYIIPITLEIIFVATQNYFLFCLEKAISSHNWSITTEGPLLYLNPVTCSLFIILLAVFLSLYVVFIKSLKRSIEQIKEDLDRRHDRTRFMDGSVYCSLPFNTQT